MCGLIGCRIIECVETLVDVVRGCGERVWWEGVVRGCDEKDK